MLTSGTIICWAHLMLTTPLLSLTQISTAATYYAFCSYECNYAFVSQFPSLFLFFFRSSFAEILWPLPLLSGAHSCLRDTRKLGGNFVFSIRYDSSYLWSIQENTLFPLPAKHVLPLPPTKPPVKGCILVSFAKMEKHYLELARSVQINFNLLSIYIFTHKRA